MAAAATSSKRTEAKSDPPPPPSSPQQHHIHPVGNSFRHSLTGEPQTWCEVDATTFRLRLPGYSKKKKKAHSTAALCVLKNVDVFRCPKKVRHIGRFLQLREQTDVEMSTAYAELGMPAMIIVNVMIPEYSPTNPIWGKPSHDGKGYSMVLCFELKDIVKEQIRRLRQCEEQKMSPPADVPNAVALLRKFIMAPNDDHELRKRLKGIARILNPTDPALNLSGMTKKLINTYNETPFLIRTTFSSHVDPKKRYFEINVDVHKFSYMALVGLNNLRTDALHCVFDFALVLQGESESELPEVLLGGAHLVKVDPEKQPLVRVPPHP